MADTTERTTWKPKCLRSDCINAALRPLSIYCSEECGVAVAAMRIAKLKSTKGLTPQKTAERLLGSRVLGAKKREGVSIWTEGESKRAWLESILGHELSLAVLEDVDDEDEDTRARLDEIPEMEKLSRLEERRAVLQRRKSRVDASLDTLAARTKLLQLAEDRVATLEPISDEEVAGESSRANVKKGKGGKKFKEAESVGQPRCGYDERLSWDDARFASWSQSSQAKEMLDDQLPIDGTLDTRDHVPATSPPQVTVCGLSKRRCKRHGDWSVIRSAGMEVEREMQTNLLSSLADEVQNLAKQMAELKALIKETLAQQDLQRREGDAILAKRLANEGTRRASTLNGH
jgi:COMPASS component SPP1